MKTTPQRSSFTGFNNLERRAEVAKYVRLRNTTLKQVVKEVFGISQGHFACLMEGTRKPSKEVAERISRFCNTSLMQFWGQETFNSSAITKKRRDKH